MPPLCRHGQKRLKRGKRYAVDPQGGSWQGEKFIGTKSSLHPLITHCLREKASTQATATHSKGSKSSTYHGQRSGASGGNEGTGG